MIEASQVRCIPGVRSSTVRAATANTPNGLKGLTFTAIESIPSGRRGRVASVLPWKEWAEVIPIGMSVTFDQLGLKPTMAGYLNKKARAYGLFCKVHRNDNGVTAFMVHPAELPPLRTRTRR